MVRRTLLLAVTALSLNAQNPADDLSDYRDLVTRAKGGDATVDYRQMRFLCLRIPACRLRSTPDQLVKLASITEPNAKLAYADTLLEEGFVNLEVHADQVAMYQKLGDSPRAARSLAIVTGLLSSIVKGRDGNTPETAYEVIVDREMYMVLSMRGLPQPIYGQEFKMEQLTVANRKYTRYVARNSRSGALMTVYFDVTESNEKSSGAVPPIRR